MFTTAWQWWKSPPPTIPASKSARLRLNGREYPSQSILSNRSQAENPGAKLFLLLGGDSYGAFENWYKPDRIRELANLIVYHRSGSSLNSGSDDRVFFADGPMIQISSTLVRNALHSGRSIRYMVTESVHAYIVENKLYG